MVIPIDAKMGFDMGKLFGQQSAALAKVTYAIIINGAEVESDLLDIMSLYWQCDKLLVASMFSEFDALIVGEGWREGFLDYVFPLRYYA